MELLECMCKLLPEVPKGKILLMHKEMHKGNCKLLPDITKGKCKLLPDVTKGKILPYLYPIQPMPRFCRPAHRIGI